MTGTALTTIGDLVTLQRGTTYKGALVGAEGPALLGLGSITPGGGFRPDYKTYGGECPPPIMLTPGDLYVSLKGATKDGEMIGSIARVPDSVPLGRLTQDTVKLNIRDDEAMSRSYLYWLLRTPRYRSYCAARATGSAVVALSRDDFLSYPVPLETAIRSEIVATLEAVESRIFGALRQIALVDQLQRLRFNELLAANVQEWQPLGEVVNVTKGVSYKSVELQSSRTSLVTLKSFDRDGGYRSEGLKPYVGRYKDAQVITPGEVVVAQTDLTQGAEVVGRAVRVPADHSADILIASLDLVIVRPSDSIVPDYLLGVLSDEAFREHCRRRTSGTTVLHLAGNAIVTYQAPIVSRAAQESYAQRVRPLIELTDSLNREVVNLRDLMSSLLVALQNDGSRKPELVAA